MTPAVSIVMPFRDASGTLREAMASIASQTYSRWELIAVDDGSADGSAHFLPDDPRLRLLSPGRVGLAEALNIGLEEARAPLVARMDADDVMLPSRLERQLDYLNEHPEISLVATRVEIVPEHAIQDGFREYLRWQDGCVTAQEIAANIYVEAPFAHPTVMFRRSAGLRYRSGDFPEDYELWLRMHEQGLLMAKIPEVLLLWRRGAGVATLTDVRYSRAAFDRIRAEYLSRDPRLTGDRPLVIWGAGRRTRQRLRDLLTRVSPTGWIDIDPRKIGQLIEGVTVHAPDWLARDEKPFVLACVTAHGARELIAERLGAWGYQIGADYLPVGI